MVYLTILAVVLALTFYFIQSRHNVIEELRKPFKLYYRIQESPRIKIAMAIAVLFGVVGYFMWPTFLGQYPVGGDHHVHMLKIRIMDDLLKNWQMRGWSQKLFAGYPYGYFYSPFVELIPISLNALSFNLLSFDQSYSVTLFFAYFMKGLAGFIFGYRAFGFGAGLLTGLFLLLDPGLTQQGGRSWFLTTGVWVSDFAIALQMIGISYIRDIWTSPTKKSFFMFAFFSGIALLLHPLPLLLLALTTFTSLIAYIATQNVAATVMRRSLSRYCIAILLIMLISSYFMLPFLTLADQTRDFGTVWHSISGLGKKISELKLFGDQNPIIFICGCLAILILTLSNKFWPFFIAITTLLSLVIFSTDIFQWLPFLKDIPFITHIELPRTAVFIKYFFFAGAAYLIIKFLSSLSGFTDLIKIESNKLKVMIRVSFVAILLAIILQPMLTQNEFSMLKNNVIYNGADKSEQYMQKIASWLNKKVDLNSGFPVRTAIWHKEYSVLLFDIYKNARLPLYNVNYTPATNFNYKAESTNSKLLSHLNIRYVVATEDLPSANFRLQEKFGPFAIYENRSWRRTSPWNIIRGSGKINNLKISDHEIRFSTTKSSIGKAMLFVAYFPNWHLKINGLEAPLEGRQYLGIKTTNFMTFELKAGEYQLTFEKGWLELLSIGFSILGIALLFSIIFSNRLSFKVL